MQANISLHLSLHQLKAMHLLPLLDKYPFANLKLINALKLRDLKELTPSIISMRMTTKGSNTCFS